MRIHCMHDMAVFVPDITNRSRNIIHIEFLQREGIFAVPGITYEMYNHRKKSFWSLHFVSRLVAR